jgi:hypothetical protein
MNYTQKYLLDKIDELKKKLSYYEAPSCYCGSDVWSTGICDQCLTNVQEKKGQLELDCE